MTIKIFNNSFYHLVRPLDNRLLDAADRLDSHPLQKFSWGETCSVGKERFYEYEMIPSVVFWAREFMKDIGYGMAFQITDIWKNTYRRGSVEEPRDYSNCDLCAVIFLDDYIPEEGGKFYFVNRHRAQLGTVWGSLDAEKYYVDYKKGDMVLFPSYMVHGVSRFKISKWDDIIKRKRRRTVGVNINIRGWEPWEYSAEKGLYEEAMRIEFNK